MPGIGDELGVHDLEGARGPGALLVGQVDRPHAPLAEEADDAEVPGEERPGS